MIKILIYEYVTGGGLINEDLSSTLLNEAKLITSNLYSDMRASDGVSFNFFLDERLNNLVTSESILINRKNIKCKTCQRRTNIFLNFCV